MPRTMPNGLMELLNKKTKKIETHSTVQVNVIGGAVPTNYYFATARLVVNGVEWAPHLRKVSSISASLTRATTQAVIELQNVDRALGIEFTQVQDYLSGAAVVAGRYWKDHDSGAEFHKVFLTGVLVVPRVGEQSVDLTGVSDAFSGVSVGATRRVTRSCQWRFRQPDTCGYNGAETVCNFLINDAGGCQGRHGDPLKRAKFGGFAYINSRSKLVTI